MRHDKAPHCPHEYPVRKYKRYKKYLRPVKCLPVPREIGAQYVHMHREIGCGDQRSDCRCEDLNQCAAPIDIYTRRVGEH